MPRTKHSQAFPPRLRGILVGLVHAFLAASVLTFAAQHAWLLWLEHWTGDFRTALLSDRLPTQHPHVAVVVITEQTLASYPYLTPVDRGLLADLISAIDSAGPRSIGIDVAFLRPTEPAKDDRLAATLRGTRARIILGAIDERTPLAPAQESFQRDFLAKSGRPAGYFNLLTDRDQIVRYIPGPAPSQTYPHSFATLVAGAEGGEVEGHYRRIAWLLPPQDNSDTFFMLPAEHLLGIEAGKAGRPHKDLRQHLENRVVLVGGDMLHTDRHYTPLSLSEADPIPGVLINAQVVAQILDKRAIRQMPVQWLWPLLMASTLVGLMFGHRMGRQAFGWPATLMTIAIVSLDILLFLCSHIVTPFTSGAAAILIGITSGVASRLYLDRARVSQQGR
jgi:CHASE2 domain-containing sensor protein